MDFMNMHFCIWKQFFWYHSAVNFDALKVNSLWCYRTIQIPLTSSNSVKECIRHSPRELVTGFHCCLCKRCTMPFFVLTSTPRFIWFLGSFGISVEFFTLSWHKYLDIVNSMGLIVLLLPISSINLFLKTRRYSKCF